MVEEMLIARCRAKQCIVKLQDHHTNISLPSTQRGFKGHVIVYPQKVGELLNVLPPPVDDIVHLAVSSKNLSPSPRLCRLPALCLICQGVPR